MRKLFLLAALVVGVAAAGPARAADWTVFAGPPTKPPKSVPPGTDFDDFYPSYLRVDAGDRVTFATTGLHTVTFLGGRKRGGFPRLVAASSTYAGGRDAAGKPWWWRGRRKLVYGTGWLADAGGSTVSSPDELHNAVVSPSLGKPRVTYSFPEPGVYRYVCLLHPFMQGTIVVRPAGEDVPSPSQVLRAAGLRLGHDWAAAARRAQATPRARNTVLAGVGTKRFGVNAFLPASLTVKVGTTVTFLPGAPGELHDVAFGPPAYLKALVARTDAEPRRPGARANQVTPLYRYGTDPPPYVYDGRNHGNGTLVTPLADGVTGSCLGCSRVTLPGRTRITFTRPGVYRYVCLLHAPEMHGVIVVRR